MNWVLHASLLTFLILVTVALALYRKYLENHCDHYIHLHGDTHDTSVITSQSDMCKRIDTLDKVKTAMYVGIGVYVLAAAALGAYQAWNANA